MQINKVKFTEPGKTSAIEVVDTVFNRDFNEPLIHQVVTACMAATRAGTHAQKTRAEVRGGGAKPWKQKGTGRARAGSNRSPLWRGGGRIFAAVPRDYSQKINKKMYRGALCSILSELNRQNRLLVVDDIKVAQPKTKALLELLNKHDLAEALIVTESLDENLYLSARNLKRVGVMDVADVDPVTLVRYNKVVFTEAALKQLEERLS